VGIRDGYRQKGEAMFTKVKIELEFLPSTGKYRVKSCVNSLDPKPGQIVTAKEAEELIVRCGRNGGSVTVREGKR
ncbi:MAG: hypothetical protein EBR52_06835, partial [Microbacteriaceae bacterium]|nr:hypothetical protein [Microbacteriaceae bacterium]